MTTMRQITSKQVQTHFSCVCGRNVVDHDTFPIRWVDLSKAGIVRKKDASTGKPFLLMREVASECHCYDEI